MTRKKAGAAEELAAEQVVEPKECFIIMPIADRDGYEEGHFGRVYEWIIKPACEKAGYVPKRADDISASHMIVADILKRIVEAPMTICDISSLNANVMFELGIRQAFGKPVALIKDGRTKSVFDISGLRYSDYSSSLRADLVRRDVDKLASMLRETGENGAGMTSLMSLVQIEAASMPQPVPVSDDSKLILQQLHELSRKVESTSYAANFNRNVENKRWKNLIAKIEAIVPWERDELRDSYIRLFASQGYDLEQLENLSFEELDRMYQEEVFNQRF